ncbi:hypothetical protein CDD81_6415 [Ophiocordyceps australis]|uniref:SMP domain-containing protein n=1 Tax=Ophiocordyceps australis TaxID=1399860 RepID=A0A2C5Y6D6_9HYPO|nr:hypothetical protein CDD81_6415 [Ophiocordyceps australis]
MKVTAILIAAIAGLAAAMPLDSSSDLVQRSPQSGRQTKGQPGRGAGNSKFTGRIDPAILPASTFGHNPKGAAPNANSNIRAQKNASKGDIIDAAQGAREFLANPRVPKGTGKAVDTGSFNPFDIRD